MRDMHLRGAGGGTGSGTTSVSSSSLAEDKQRTLLHALEECTSACFLWGEPVHHGVDSSGVDCCSCDVTTNSTMVRLCELDRCGGGRGEGQAGTASPAHIIASYLLQSLQRFFGVQVSGHCVSVQSPPRVPANKPLSVVKFSATSRIASPLCVKQNHISNDYDSFLDVDDSGDVIDAGFESKTKTVSVSSVYSHGSFDLCPGDVIFTEAELLVSKLRGVTAKAGSVLDTLEDELTGASVESTLTSQAGTPPYKCIPHLITADLPTYALDFPMEVEGQSDRALKVSSPAVLAKLRKGEAVDVFAVRIMPSVSTWLLLSSGWIPGSAATPALAEPFRLPRALSLHPSSAPLASGDQDEGLADDHVLVECLYQGAQCKGKSAPFRRHTKACLTKSNSYVYDKSPDLFSTAPS